MFKSVQNKGFSMTFESGFTISVQFGKGNYADNRNTTEDSMSTEVWECNNAEVAIIPPDGEVGDWLIVGWANPNKVADIIQVMNYYDDIVQIKRKLEILKIVTTDC